MLVLGIDPGLDRCGVAWVDMNLVEPVCLWHGLIQTDKNDGTMRRLQVLRDDFREVLAMHDPDLVVMEGLHAFGRAGAQMTIINVAHARGVLLLELQERDCQVIEPLAHQWKAQMNIAKGATKPAIRHAVNDLFPHLQGQPRVDDVNDAIGLAYGGYYMAGGM